MSLLTYLLIYVESCQSCQNCSTGKSQTWREKRWLPPTTDLSFWKFRTTATGHPIHFIFGFMVAFSGSADGVGFSGPNTTRKCHKTFSCIFGESTHSHLFHMLTRLLPVHCYARISVCSTRWTGAWCDQQQAVLRWCWRRWQDWWVVNWRNTSSSTRYWTGIETTISCAGSQQQVGYRKNTQSLSK